MNHYIRVLTGTELSDDQMSDWFDTVTKFAPNGTVIVDDKWDDDSDESYEVEVDDDEDYGNPNMPFIYEVSLTRHLTKVEAEFIVAAWEMRYEDDFEIESSNLYSTDQVDTDLQHQFDMVEMDVDEETHKNIEEAASKFLHNRWVESQIQEGWRYGLRVNNKERTSPLLRDWDSLDESYKRSRTMSKQEAVDFFTKYKSLFQ